VVEDEVAYDATWTLVGHVMTEAQGSILIAPVMISLPPLLLGDSNDSVQYNNKTLSFGKLSSRTELTCNAEELAAEAYL
jgi:hypothetical protein